MKRNSEATNKYKSGPIKAIPQDYQQIQYYDEEQDDSFNQLGDQTSSQKSNKTQMSSKPQSHIDSDSYSTSSSIYSHAAKTLSPNTSSDFKDVPTKRIVLVSKSNKANIKPRAQSASRSSSIKKITIRSASERGGDKFFRNTSNISRKTSSNSFSNYSDFKETIQPDRYSFSPHLSESYYTEYNNEKNNNIKINRKHYSANTTPRENRIYTQSQNNNNNNNTFIFSQNLSKQQQPHNQLNYISYPLESSLSIDIESTKYLESQLQYEKEMRQLLWKDIQLLRNELDKLINKDENEIKNKNNELYDIYISLIETKKLFNIRNEILINDKNKLGGDSIKTLSAFEISAQIDSLLALNFRIYVYLYMYLFI